MSHPVPQPSVVSSSPAIEAAFCYAVRVTLVGSITLEVTRFSYTSVGLPLGARVLGGHPERLLRRTISTPISSSSVPGILSRTTSAPAGRTVSPLSFRGETIGEGGLRR